VVVQWLLLLLLVIEKVDMVAVVVFMVDVWVVACGGGIYGGGCG